MTAEQLHQEWRAVRAEGISYKRAGIDDNLTEDTRAKGDSLFRREKEIEETLFSMGYEIVDGEQPYQTELKKIE